MKNVLSIEKKYIKVGNEYFETLKDLKDKVTKIKNDNKDKKLNRDDEYFMISLFEMHPNNHHKELLKKSNFDFIDVRDDEYVSQFKKGVNHCFWINCKDGTNDKISFIKIIKKNNPKLVYEIKNVKDNKNKYVYSIMTEEKIIKKKTRKDKQFEFILDLITDEYIEFGLGGKYKCILKNKFKVNIYSNAHKIKYCKGEDLEGTISLFTYLESIVGVKNIKSILSKFKIEIDNKEGKKEWVKALDLYRKYDFRFNDSNIIKYNLLMLKEALSKHFELPDKSTIFVKGKYAGEDIIDICFSNPSYVHWIIFQYQYFDQLENKEYVKECYDKYVKM